MDTKYKYENNTNFSPTNNSKSKLGFLIIIIVIILSIFFILFFTVNEKKQLELKKMSDKKEEVEQSLKEVEESLKEKEVIIKKLQDKIDKEKQEEEKFKEKEIFNTERITRKIENFINTNLMSDDEHITIKEKVKEEHGLYKVTIDIRDKQSLDVYVTKDEKLIFPQALDIQEIEEAKAPQSQEKNLIKNEKPKVELFVMSYCPYGTQIEKGFLPVLHALGNKIDFEIKFVDYAMHGKKEINEQINQYCIQKEEVEKYLDYLKCFLEDGDYDNCIIKTGINISKLNTCNLETEKAFNPIANFNDKNTYKGNFPTFNIHKEENLRYKVEGSPTLVVNGQQVSTKRDPKSLLATVCSYFNNSPTECDAILPDVSAVPGFGFDKIGNATEASCG